MTSKEKTVNKIYELLEIAAEQQLILKECVYTNFESELKKALKKEIDETSTRDVLLSLDEEKLVKVTIALNDAVVDYKYFNSNALFLVPEFEF